MMNKKKTFRAIWLITALTLGVSLVSVAEKINTAQKQKKHVTERTVKELQDDFLKLKFGMFLHYNMATYKNVQWVEGYHSPADFNPGVDIVDTDAWADAAVSTRRATATGRRTVAASIFDRPPSGMNRNLQPWK